MKDILFAKPKTLSETEEHVIVKRKWWAVILLIIGGVILAGRVPNIPVFIPYVLFFFGHGGMLHSFWNKRDYPMVIVNAVWLLIDMLGAYRWFHV
jgi:hypothetical protein